jgi:serine/threonine protein kinase
VIELAREDENLDGLVGRELASELGPGVRYRLEHALGRGGGSVAFLASRLAEGASVPVVVKILRPSFVRKLGPTANLIIRKEAVALGRLNEQVPPTPFVIRMLDTGTLRASRADAEVELPWIVVEYVHGGALGTTLAQRVRRQLRDHGCAFDPVRASVAVDCITQGLAAVHAVGVIHRDLTPNNVLCSGRGADEIFKLADFGVARPVGVSGTLSGSLVGTPGYAAPELSTGEELGTFTDVFSLASVLYFVLTGEPLYASTGDVMRSLQTGQRRSLLDAPGLHPDLRRHERACRSIDLVLGWAGAPRPADRLAEALAVGSMILPHLTRLPRSERSTSLPPPAPGATGEGATEPSGWTWSTLHAPSDRLVLRSVAWDGHGRAIAATAEGLSFWSGTQWKVASAEGMQLGSGLHIVQRVGAGRWVLGGDDASLFVYATGGVTERVPSPRGARTVLAFSGDLDDLSVLAARQDDGRVALHGYASRRWLRPLELPEVATVAGLARFDDARFLVVGRRHDGSAFAALYCALDWELEELPTPEGTRALLACATRARKSIGFAVGTQGVIVTQDGDTTTAQRVHGEPPLTAVAVDPLGRPWVACSGRLLYRDDARGWQTAWKDAALTSPVIALFLDVGLAILMTADGAVIEGRAARPSTNEPTPQPRPT